MSWLPGLFAKFFNAILVNGTTTPPEPAANLIGGSGVTIVAVDNPTTGALDITFSASGSSASVAPEHFTGASTITLTGNLTVVTATTSGSSFNLVVPAMADGQELLVIDRDDTWSAHGIGLTVGAGVSIENPIGHAVVTAGTLSLPASSAGPRSAFRFMYLASASPNPLLKMV